jgi:hypothetical protein
MRHQYAEDGCATGSAERRPASRRQAFASATACIGLALAVVMSLAGYFFSDKIALASYPPPVSERESGGVPPRGAPGTQFTQRMGLPMPKLWLIPEDSPNAFATGRNPAHASVDSRWAYRGDGQPRARSGDPMNWARAASRHSDQLRRSHAGGGHYFFGTHGILWRPRRDDDDHGGALASDASPRSPPCSFRWLSRAHANTTPTPRRSNILAFTA